jgi:hypothetical protein
MREARPKMFGGRRPNGVVTTDAAGELRVTPRSEFSSGGGGAHASTHESGGADEIDVTGLQGTLQDPQLVDVDAAGALDGDSAITPLAVKVDGATIIIDGSNELAVSPDLIDSEYDAGNSGSSKTIDWDDGRQQILTLTAACAITLANGVNGRAYRLILVQDGTGGWTPTFPSTVEFEGNAAPAWITTANKVTFVSLVKTAVGSGGYLGFATLIAIDKP